jgi:integrase
VTIAGKRHILSEGKGAKAAAYDAFHRIMAGDPSSGPTAGGISSTELVGAFLLHARRRVGDRTYADYDRYLTDFESYYGGIDANMVAVRHITDWLSAHKGWTSPNTQRNAITAVKTAWAWAHGEGRIAVNGVARCKKPKPVPRIEIISTSDIKRFFDAIGTHEFRLLMEFIYETGCRPGEAYKIEKRHLFLDRNQAVMRGKTTEATSAPRVIYLSERAKQIVGELAKINPTGPLFLNSKGRPWNGHSVACQMRRIRGRSGLGHETIAYAFRHRFITDALLSGKSSKLVAEMAGHQTTTMIDTVYSHLTEHGEEIASAVRDVRPSTKNGGA